MAILHDVGKLAIPDAILHKPGPLDEAEWTVMRTHPIASEQLLAQVPSLHHLCAAVRAEHERWDGTGYPDGLAGRAIPLASRITLVCDAFHAMTSDRPYRAGMSVADAFAEIEAGSGTQFCPRRRQRCSRSCVTGRPLPFIRPAVNVTTAAPIRLPTSATRSPANVPTASPSSCPKSLTKSSPRR